MGNTTDASETRGAEEIETNINRFLPEQNGERTKANLELLKEQTSNLTQWPNQLIHVTRRKLPQERVLVLIAPKRSHRLIWGPELLAPRLT